MKINIKDILSKRLGRGPMNVRRHLPRTTRIGHPFLPAVSKFSQREISQRQIFRSQRSRQRETFIKGITGFLYELAEKYPQISPDGEINYYICGSLSVMAMSIAGEYEILNEADIPNAVPLQKVRITPSAKKALGRFFRKIGDFDFVALPNWEQPLRRRGGFAEGDFNRWRHVWESVLSDGLEAHTPHRIARVTINGQQIYIVEPKMMLAYKTVHLGESFHKESKTKKFVSDLRALLGGLGQLYAYEELVKATHEAIFAYARNMPNLLNVPYYHSAFKGEIKDFVDAVIACDVDANYLKELEFGQERSIGILMLLHRLKSAEAKTAMVDYINAHRELIDCWSSGTKKIPISSDLLNILTTVDEANIWEEFTAISALMNNPILRGSGYTIFSILNSKIASQTEGRQALLRALMSISESSNQERQIKILHELQQLVVSRELFIPGKVWEYLSFQDRIALIPRIVAGETLRQSNICAR